MKQNSILKQGLVLKGRYQILGSLGNGGMAEVFLARDLEDGSKVAVKKDSGREADILLKLDHEGIVWGVDTFWFRGEKFLVEEFVDGEDLRSNVRREGPFSIAEAFEIGLELCDVLDYLHNQSPPVIYRDLKPQNILIRKDGGIILVDFGIAREYISREDYDTTSYGTPGYAAPEQFEGSRSQSDARTDLFALGKVLCFLISGLDPKKQGNDLSRLIPDREAEKILRVCMERNPEERWQSASELAYELQRWLGKTNQPEYAAGKSNLPEIQVSELFAEDCPEIKNDNRRQKKQRPDPVALLLIILSVLIYISGAILGLGRVYQGLTDTGEMHWLPAALIWSAAFASGTLVLGFAQIIRRLSQIKSRI